MLPALTLRIVQPTPEARARLVAYYNQIVDRRRGEFSDVSDFAARWAEQAWRLALVLHAGLHGAQAHGHQLTLETAVNAIDLIEWFVNQQLNLLSKGRRHSARKLEDEVFELLADQKQRRGVGYVTVRDVQRARIAATADAARALLERMERDGLLMGEDVTPTGGGKTMRLFRRVSGSNPFPD